MPVRGLDGELNRPRKPAANIRMPTSFVKQILCLEISHADGTPASLAPPAVSMKLSTCPAWLYLRTPKSKLRFGVHLSRAYPAPS